ncbi:hypothetical protein E5170_16675 [Pseudomonas atacamensis]|uniref:Uncharacterized protein n=1 Tax=Pseudomonas atacamensis TaxID=2565368 RepID=A0AAQ2DBY4_9PSED|nr:hypothetical protein E5170_16675 [Pseudomonas atacamensis]
MWRGDLSPLGCEAVVNHCTRCFWYILIVGIGAASQPNGDKSPRHKGSPAYCSVLYVRVSG